MNHFQQNYTLKTKENFLIVPRNLKDALCKCQVSGLQGQMLQATERLTVCKGVPQAKITSIKFAECMSYNFTTANIRAALAALIRRKILIKDKKGVGFNFDFNSWKNDRL